MSRVRPDAGQYTSKKGDSMNNFGWVLTGGFAKGYRTYILIAVAIGSAIASYSVGDIDLLKLIESMALALGVGTLRASVPSVVPPTPPAV
jgi:hypothetical protein